jgi:hypothetical protein
MSRLKLFGEGQPEGGTTDHSALANLGYAQSGHTGFVPSQGEALIDILRLNQNLIRDSEGNDRLQLAPSSPHLTLPGDVRNTGHMGVGNRGTLYNYMVLHAEENFDGPSTVYALYAIANQKRSDGGGSAIGVGGLAQGEAAGPSSYVRGLQFTARHASAYGLSVLQGMYMGVQTFSNKGALSYLMGGYIYCQFGANTPVTDARGLWIRNFGHAQVGTAYGLKIDNQEGAGVNRILELGPTTPFLRLVGGDDPPTDKSNLYLKFGSTLYRVVKSGSYMTLEAP